MCRKEHRTSTKHRRQEVTDAINKLKAHRPTALLTFEDLQYVVNMAVELDEEDDDSSDDKEVL